MSDLTPALLERSAACELCGAEDGLDAVLVLPTDGEDADRAVLACGTCREAIDEPMASAAHFRCLTGSIWSEVGAVQVLSWRLLQKLRAETWAADALDGAWLEDDRRRWAEDDGLGDVVITKDSNGTVLEEGDSVTLIKDLDVKGANFTAKRGTMVKNIHLTGNADLVEGRVGGSVIVLRTEFLKRQG